MAQPHWIKFQHFFIEDQGLGLFIDHSSVQSMGTAYGRRGDWGYRLFGAGAYIEAATEDLDEFADGFAFRFASATSGVFWQVSEGSTIHLQLVRNSDGSISLYRGDSGAGGTLLDTSDPGIAPLNVYIFFAVQGIIDNAAGAVDVYLDGANRISLAATDTQNGGTGVVNRHRWRGSGTPFDSEWNIADIYCADAADAAFHLMHDWRGEIMLADADVLAEFVRSTGATNFGTINEVPFSATDYNSSDVSGDRDRYGHAAGARTDPLITLAIVAQLAKDSGSASAKVGLLDGANLIQGSAVVLSTTPSVHSLIICERPVSGDPLDTTVRDAMVTDVENVT